MGRLNWIENWLFVFIINKFNTISFYLFEVVGMLSTLTKVVFICKIVCTGTEIVFSIILAPNSITILNATFTIFKCQYALRQIIK